MELRDYLRILKRGWLTVMVTVLLSLTLGVLYLSVTPKRYESATTLYILADEPATLGDLEQGAQFARGAVLTYAEIIESALVLEPVAGQLRPPGDLNEVVWAVSTSVPEDTTLINIVATGDDPRRVADIANAVAAEAGRVLPSLGTAADGRSLLRVQPTRTAIPPIGPVSPDNERTLALAFIVGLCIGLALTVTRQVMYPRVFTSEDVGDLTDVPLLATVRQRHRALSRRRHVNDVPLGASGDSYRTLRTNLRIVDVGDLRCLLITSVTHDRSGAQVAANLAWSLALAGGRVLLVDMDLRNSAVGEAFGMPRGLGFADVVTGRAKLHEVVRPTENPELQIVMAGSAQSNPSDLLSGAMVNTVLRQMERHHDYVILHAPPLLAYTDAAVVASLARGTLVTMTSRRTRANDLTSALSVLSKVRIRPVGLVLTGAKPRGSRSVIEDDLGRSHAETLAEPGGSSIQPPPARQAQAGVLVTGSMQMAYLQAVQPGDEIEAVEPAVVEHQAAPEAGCWPPDRAGVTPPLAAPAPDRQNGIAHEEASASTTERTVALPVVASVRPAAVELPEPPPLPPRSTNGSRNPASGSAASGLWARDRPSPTPRQRNTDDSTR